MRITSLDNINDGVNTWMSETGVKRIIAFSGSSSTEKIPGIDESLARSLSAQNQAYVDAIIHGTVGLLRDYRIAILTGGTEGGVPESATKIAKAMGLPTIGVYPESRSEKDSLAKKGLLDCAIEVGSVFGKSMFGDESTVFAKLADASIIFGGNAGTLVEVSHALKLNESLLTVNRDGKVVPKNESEHPKYIVPVDGIPGVSGVLKLLPGKSYVREGTFPERNIRSSRDIFEYVRNRLHLDEIHKDDTKK